MFLTTDQLRQMTGYVKRNKQVEWLRKQGIMTTVNRYGEALVLVKQVEHMLMPELDYKVKRTMPDEKALKKELGIS